MNNEEDDAVGVCTECGNQQPDKYMFNSVFAKGVTQLFVNTVAEQ